MNLRELILDMLMEIEKGNTYSHILVRNVLDKHDYLTVQEKAFIKRITEGTLERRIQIDYIIDSYSKVPVNKMKPLICSLLRMSVYQILFMDGVPDSAVCNEAVKLSVKRKFQSLKGFINGVLRTVARQKDHIIYPDRKTDLRRYLSVWYSMPEFLISMWIKDYGEERTEEMLKAMLEVRPVTIRLKQTMGEEEQKELLGRIAASGISIKKHSGLPYAYELEHVDGVRSIPGFGEGLLTVQDVSSMICVESAGIKDGDFVIDVCAAPGGKATHAAVKLKGGGKVLARDLTEEKTALIKENIARQKLSNITAETYDAAVYDETLKEKADAVLADLPCSGLGIIGKKRDIKYKITKEALEELPLLQKKILSTVWQYVKPGGALVYSTCTLNKEENEKVAEWFLENYPFTLEEMRQLLPGVHGTDGFFIARLRRIDERF